MDIARLVTVPVSQIWRNETHDFTPWLERNLDLLGEALNLNLEPAEREVKGETTPWTFWQPMPAQESTLPSKTRPRKPITTTWERH